MSDVRPDHDNILPGTEFEYICILLNYFKTTLNVLNSCPALLACVREAACLV